MFLVKCEGLAKVQNIGVINSNQGNKFVKFHTH